MALNEAMGSTQSIMVGSDGELYGASDSRLVEAKGQKVALNEAMGSTQSIMVGSDGELYGASDSRLVDDLTAGY